MNEIRKPYFYCPRCKTFNVWEFDMHIYCPTCMLTFKKTTLQDSLDDDILAMEELKKISSLFDEENVDVKRLID